MAQKKKTTPAPRSAHFSVMQGRKNAKHATRTEKGESKYRHKVRSGEGD